MIRHAGLAHCNYDFSKTVEERLCRCIFPDGTSYTDVPTASILFFDIISHNGATPFRSLTTFALVANSPEEATAFALLRACLVIEKNEREGRAFCTKCGAKIWVTEPSCSRCGANQFSLNSLAAEVENVELRAEQMVKNLTERQDAVMMTKSFKVAEAQILEKPVDLMPLKPSAFHYVLFRSRIWKTKEYFSPEEWDVLVRNHDEKRLNARASALAKSGQQREPRYEPSGLSVPAGDSMKSWIEALNDHDLWYVLNYFYPRFRNLVSSVARVTDMSIGHVQRVLDGERRNTELQAAIVKEFRMKMQMKVCLEDQFDEAVPIRIQSGDQPGPNHQIKLQNITVPQPRNDGHGSDQNESQSEREKRMKHFWTLSENSKLYPIGRVLAEPADVNRTLADVLASGEDVEMDSILVNGRSLPLVPGFRLSLENLAQTWGCPVCRSAHGSGIYPSRRVTAERLAKNQFYYRPADRRLFIISDTCWKKYVVGLGADTAERFEPV